jgi:hypothetical protein
MDEKEIPPGTLVQVRDDALGENAEYRDSNRDSVERHGWIWIIEWYEKNSGSYYCRSLATGSEDHVWLEEELNVLKEQTDG